MRYRRKNPNNQIPSDQQPDQSLDEIITRTYTGRGDLLALDQMHATVVVESGPYEELAAVVTGYRSVVDKLTQDATPGLSLNGIDIAEMFNFSVKMTGNLFSWFRQLSGSLQIVRQIIASANKDHLQIKITVPAKTAIHLRNFRGSITADGQYAAVNASVSSDTVLVLDSIAGLRLNAGSGTDATVKTINGDCRLELGYNSKLMVGSGRIGTLNLDVGSGSCSVLMASCQAASYTASYNTELTLGSLLGSLVASAGSGSVFTVTCQDADRLRFKTSYDCTINASGAVENVSLDVGHNCKANLGAVRQQLIARASYDCAIITSAGGGTSSVSIQMGSTAVLRLIGTVERGTIVLGYNGDVLVGQLARAVSTDYGSNTRVRAGYFAA